MYYLDAFCFTRTMGRQREDIFLWSKELSYDALNYRPIKPLPSIMEYDLASARLAKEEL